VNCSVRRSAPRVVDCHISFGWTPATSCASTTTRSAGGVSTTGHAAGCSQTRGRRRRGISARVGAPSQCDRRALNSLLVTTCAAAARSSSKRRAVRGHVGTCRRPPKKARGNCLRCRGSQFPASSNFLLFAEPAGDAALTDGSQPSGHRSGRRWPKHTAPIATFPGQRPGPDRGRLAMLSTSPLPRSS